MSVASLARFWGSGGFDARVPARSAGSGKEGQVGVVISCGGTWPPFEFAAPSCGRDRLSTRGLDLRPNSEPQHVRGGRRKESFP